MIDTSFLQSLKKFSLIMEKHVTSNLIGQRKSPMTGRGLIYKDHGIYSFGDDFRAIDWKVYARTDKLHIKRFEEERNLTVHIIIDYSASMGFGTPVRKSDYASMIGIGFAYMALGNNEKFVLSTFADSLELFRARRGRNHIAVMVDYLNTKKAKGQSKLEDSLLHYSRNIDSRSMVIIISDFLYPCKEIESIVIRFKDHKLKLIQVLDKSEYDLDLEGDVKLTDPETNEKLQTFISPALKKQYKSQLLRHVSQIQHLCNQAKAEFHTISTSVPIFDAFVRIMNNNSR